MSSPFPSSTRTEKRERILLQKKTGRKMQNAQIFRFPYHSGQLSRVDGTPTKEKWSRRLPLLGK